MSTVRATAEHCDFLSQMHPTDRFSFHREALRVMFFSSKYYFHREALRVMFFFFERIIPFADIFVVLFTVPVVSVFPIGGMLSCYLTQQRSSKTTFFVLVVFCIL